MNVASIEVSYIESIKYVILRHIQYVKDVLLLIFDNLISRRYIINDCVDL